MDIDKDRLLREFDELANPTNGNGEEFDIPNNGNNGKKSKRAVTLSKLMPLKRKQKCQVNVLLNTKLPVSCRQSEWERGGVLGYTFTFNPKRIKTQEKLEQHIQSCREFITG